MSARGYHEVAGQWVPWGQFIREFHRYVTERKGNPATWTEARIRRALGPGNPIGRGPRNVKIVGNMSRQFRRPRRFILTETGDVRLENPHIVNAA